MQQNKVESQDEKLHQFQKALNLSINNGGSASIKVDRSHNYLTTGGFQFQNIPAHGSFSFVHGSNVPTANMAAVQYSGLSKSGETLAMIVAFDAPADYCPPNSPNRVYTYCNKKYIVDCKTWEEILMCLEKASSSDANASIVHKAPETAVVVANINFDNCNSAEA